jgi:tetratricopeptide (TPR) repeat protein
LVELEPILERVGAGDPVGAAYRLSQEAGAEAPGKLFYDAGSVALSRRDELGEDALRFARLAFAEAVERDPQLGEAHHDLATTMRELGMADDAIAHYRKALELLPDDVDSLIGLGAAQCDSGKLDEAIVSLEHAAQSHPDNGRAFANLGVALEAAGKDERAVAAYAKAVARFDAQLGEVGDDDETAADVAARRRWARIQHAELLERLERWPQAIVEFRRLYEEEQALAEAEEAAAEVEAEQEERAAADEEAAAPAPMADAPALPPADHEGETLLEDDTFAEAEAAADAELGLTDDDDLGEEGDEPDVDDEDDEDEAGRSGLERLFARLVMARRFDLAFLVLDDLGGELADARTRATYAVYDPGDGLLVIMVEHWDGGERERLDPWTQVVPP